MGDGRRIGKTADADTLAAVSAEVARARAKFPRNAHLLAALTEEVGELAAAMLEGLSLEEIQKEAIQVACVACRIVEEGDADFPCSIEPEVSE